MTITECVPHQDYSITMLKDHNDPVPNIQDIQPEERGESEPSIHLEHTQVAEMIPNTRVEEASHSSKTLNACCPRQTAGINMHNGSLGKVKKKKNTPSLSSYNIGYFTLWLGRMQREGRKEAEASKIRAEDEAASRGMNMLLGCGQRLLLEDNLLKAKTREKFKSETR